MIVWNARCASCCSADICGGALVSPALPWPRIAVDVNRPFFTGVVRSAPPTTFELCGRSCLEGEPVGVRVAPVLPGEADGDLTADAGGDGFTSLAVVEVGGVVISTQLLPPGVESTAAVQLAAECSFFGLLAIRSTQGQKTVSAFGIGQRKHY
jgi:hypothetical protein|eukprot:COSAG02_NODE_13511_length_1384_cov_4.973028_1_plen_153_part_00